MRPRGTLLLALTLILAVSAPAGAATLAKRVAAGSPSGSPLPALGGHALGGHEYALVGVQASSFRAKLALAAAGSRLLSPALGIWRLPSRATGDVTARLSLLGALRYVEPDRPLVASAHLTHGDPLATPELAWHLYRIGADRVEPPGPGVPITVIDVGLDISHPEFSARPNTILLNQQSIPSLDFGNYHGTFVASTAAAPADGVGTVGVYPEAVLRSYDTPTITVRQTQMFSDASIVEAIDASLKAGPSVINLSFGGPAPNRALYEAVTRAFGLGSIVVAASGNDFLRGDRLSYPASYPHVLTVASTDRQDAPSLFSSSGQAVDVAAPGEDIPFQHPSDSSSRMLTGTSFSTPIVAAAAAWVWTARQPRLEKTQVYELMRSSARDLAPAGFDSRTGFGVIDLPAALNRPVPAIDPLEPNDDVVQVIARGMFARAKPSLTTRKKPKISLAGRLELSEDPDDVYRVLVPAGKKVQIAISSTDGDLGAILWHPRTPTVLTNAPSARRNWLAASDRPGATPERLVYRNRGKKPLVAYLDLWFPTRVQQQRLSYTVSIKTSR